MKRVTLYASIAIFTLLCGLTAFLPSTAYVVSYPGLSIIFVGLLYLNFHDHKEHR